MVIGVDTNDKKFNSVESNITQFVLGKEFAVKKIRFLFTAMLALIICFACVEAAFAETGESYGIYVGGVEVTSENASNITGDGITGNVSFNPETFTLTLDNAKVTGTKKYGNKYMEQSAGLYTDRSSVTLTVKLIGKNEISKGIEFGESELDFSGTGSLTVGAPSSITGSLQVVCCDALAVEKGASVMINGENYTTDRALIADYVLVNGYLKLFSPATQNSFGFAAKTKEATVYIGKTGKLEVYASVSAAYEWASGIQTYNGDIVNAGKLTVTTKGGKTSNGVNCKNLTLADGSATTIYGACEAAVNADNIKYGDKLTFRAGTSSSTTYAAKVKSGFYQKYFKAGKSLGGKVKPTTIKSLTKAKKAITVKWNSRSSYFVDGYQVQYATNSKFTSGKKTLTIKGYSNTSKKISKLKAKKKYYVRVRTYMKVSGKACYSAWSKSKSITTK